MCYQPIKIINRSSHFNDNMSLYHVVPCGKCFDCQRTYRNDWFVRCFFQWQENSQSTFFYTLTYNNDNLPYYQGLPCFSKRDVQLFLKRLRYRLDSLGIKLRYMVTSEFGTQYKRPHYHVLFFLSKPLNWYHFYKFVELSWMNGFVKYGQNQGFVNSYTGIKYVTKYVCKDFAYTDEYAERIYKRVYLFYERLIQRIRNYFNIHNDVVFRLEGHHFYFSDLSGASITDLHPSYEFCHKLLTHVRRELGKYMPFHLQSTNLGLSLLSTEYVDIPSEKVYIPQRFGVQTFALPRYYKRMLYYDVIENELDGKRNKFVLNDEGKKRLMQSLDMRIENERCRLLNAVANYKLINKRTLDNLRDAGYKFQSVSDVMHFCQNFDLDIDIMAIYSAVFRGRVRSEDCMNIVVDDTLTKDNYFDYFCYCLDYTSQRDYGEVYRTIGYRRLSSYLQYRLWDNCEFFVPYEQSLKILDIIINSSREDEADVQMLSEKDARKLRELIKNY